MSPVSITDLIAVPIDSFRRGTREIAFDVYLRLSDDNIAHVFSKTTGLDYKRLSNYMQKGVTHLHIREKDWEAYKLFSERPAIAIFSDPQATQEKKIAALLNMTEQNMCEIFSQTAVRDETIADTRKIVNGYVELLVSTPQSLAIILRLVAHGEYLYYHSVAVSIFSLFIAKACGLFNKRTAEQIGMGGFLHDIGCVMLPPELMNYSGAFSDEQWKQMHEHPRMGLDMLSQAKNIPDEVRYLVYQHHEHPKGTGYPNAIHSHTIFYPARIVALADSFSAMISKRPHRQAYTAEQAIEILMADKERFGAELINVLAAIVGQKRGGKTAA